MPDGGDHRPDEEVADADGAAEAHHPQRHHPSPDLLVHPGLQGRVEGGDEREIEGPDHRDHRYAGAGLRCSAKATRQAA